MLTIVDSTTHLHVIHTPRESSLHTSHSGTINPTDPLGCLALFISPQFCLNLMSISCLCIVGLIVVLLVLCKIHVPARELELSISRVGYIIWISCVPQFAILVASFVCGVCYI